MTNDAELVLYFAPRSRASTALWLLEELGQPYRLESFALSSGRHKQPDYLALNPMGKVPLVVDHGVPIAETGAIAVYLADRYPEAGLAPAVDDPRRAAYLRWCFFAGSVIEPALGEKFFKWELDSSSVAWGSFRQMVEVASAGVQPGPWLLGEQFSVADVLVGAGLRFAVRFGALPDEGPIGAYVKRLADRPALQRAQEIEAKELARLDG